ncbi:hypothetical protein PISMIDRAFT_674194 [Pisolithus microcarpus 441]|uniref:Uncharacterized protein n=1 Tax=Pisolithus microcarpus 441 TaxID=765257 RepID=A0A0D0A748_9AGAM|nr:hypothetical protein PISMIDRAFT_674194 [Pisolithus microcarpus 441]
MAVVLEVEVGTGTGIELFQFLSRMSTQNTPHSMHSSCNQPVLTSHHFAAYEPLIKSSLLTL